MLTNIPNRQTDATGRHLSTANCYFAEPRLVPDLTDRDPTLEQAALRGLEVRDNEIDVAE